MRPPSYIAPSLPENGVGQDFCRSAKLIIVVMPMIQFLINSNSILCYCQQRSIVSSVDLIFTHMEQDEKMLLKSAVSIYARPSSIQLSLS